MYQSLDHGCDTYFKIGKERVKYRPKPNDWISNVTLLEQQKVTRCLNNAINFLKVKKFSLRRTSISLHPGKIRF